LDVGGARRLRRDLHDLLPSEAKMMSYPAGLGGTDDDLYYQPDQWRRRDLDQVMQQLLESDRRREQEQEEEEEAAYLATLLHLLSEAEHTRLVSPGDVEVEEEGEEEQGTDDFQGPPPQDYDETGRVMMGKPPATWLSQISQLLMQRLEPQLAQALLEQARQERLQQVGALAQRAGSELSRGIDQETLRYLVARILSSIGPNNLQMNYPSRRLRRDLSISAGVGETSAVSSIHRRTRRSLDNTSSPFPSSEPPLLRVKRLGLEEEEGERSLRQRMTHVNTMATSPAEELNNRSHGRRRRAAVNYDPRALVHQIFQYLQE
ncbi:proprotein convertase subtilisin/kexin type 1 inhibitor, like, partial [Lampris incognitus]|uniref:proprotein convertase subtilisin/kexin type 1 inhibitor, like n=1 Tax=Lampris incognitus TaxID=2546036 RepID=UPI0024B5B959